MKLVNIHIQTVVLVLLFLFLGKEMNAQTYSLQQCIDTALANNKKLQISRNNQQISEQKRKEVQANLFPRIDANGSSASEWKNGLAWVIIGGLLSSLILTVYLVPVVYAMVDGIKEKFDIKD